MVPKLKPQTPEQRRDQARRERAEAERIEQAEVNRGVAETLSLEVRRGVQFEPVPHQRSTVRRRKQLARLERDGQLGADGLAKSRADAGERFAELWSRVYDGDLSPRGCLHPSKLMPSGAAGSTMPGKFRPGDARFDDRMELNRIMDALRWESPVIRALEWVCCYDRSLNELAKGASGQRRREGDRLTKGLDVLRAFYGLER